MKPFVFLVVALLLNSRAMAQVAINTDGTSANPSAILDLKSTSKGLLIPRMTTSERNTITSPAEGLLIFNTSLDKFQGFYIQNDTVIDQQQTTVMFSVDPVVRMGQSFTVSQEGYITAVEFAYASCDAGFTFEIYNGANCYYSNLLRSQASACTPVIYLNSPLHVVANQILTFFIYPGNIVNIRYTQDNPYSGGTMFDECDPVSTLDLCFKIYLAVQIPQWVDLNE